MSNTHGQSVPLKRSTDDEGVIEKRRNADESQSDDPDEIENLDGEKSSNESSGDKGFNLIEYLKCVDDDDIDSESSQDSEDDEDDSENDSD